MSQETKLQVEENLNEALKDADMVHFIADELRQSPKYERVSEQKGFNIYAEADSQLEEMRKKDKKSFEVYSNLLDIETQLTYWCIHRTMVIHYMATWSDSDFIEKYLNLDEQQKQEINAESYQLAERLKVETKKQVKDGIYPNLMAISIGIVISREFEAEMDSVKFNSKHYGRIITILLDHIIQQRKFEEVFSKKKFDFR